MQEAALASQPDVEVTATLPVYAAVAVVEAVHDKQIGIVCVETI